MWHVFPLALNSGSWGPAAEVWRALSAHDMYREHLERFVIL